MTARDEIQISEHELNSMTRDLDELHRDSFPDTKEAIADWGSRLAKSTSRRNVLLGGVAALGTVTLAACGSKKTTVSPGTSSAPASTGGSPYTGDLKVVALAAALENLAVAAYGLVLTNAGKGAYGTVPPAIANFVTVAKMQHTDHGAGWNAVLTSAGKPAVTGASLSITSGAVAALMAAKTIPAVATQALGLENAAASTYLEAVGAVTDPGGIQVAATIAPVEAMHAAILSFVLGKYPVPATFLSLTGAVPPSALTV